MPCKRAHQAIPIAPRGKLGIEPSGGFHCRSRQDERGDTESLGLAPASVLPTGIGLFAFSTVEAACAAAEELRLDYRRHADAARSLAEEYFDSDRVLTRLLEKLGAGR